MSGLQLLLTGPLSLVFGALLIWLRHHFFGHASLGNFCLGAGMALQFAGYQRMLAPTQPRGMAQGIEISQWGWFLFALSLPGLGPALASVGFLVSQALIKAPLASLLSTSGLKHRWLILAGFLALVGCLPFASFSAYFQAFVPLMAVGDAVTTMQQKLFSGAGLWAALVLLSVVYQSCALGYFYWSKIMQAAGDEPAAPWTADAWLAMAGLALSAGLGLFRGAYSAFLRAALSALGVEIEA